MTYIEQIERVPVLSWLTYSGSAVKLKVEHLALPSACWKFISSEHSPAGEGYAVNCHSLKEESNE